MANPLTGDFEAVLQVSGATVNRLLASIHQNGGTKPKLPGFPHGTWLRVGDPTPIGGMRGTVLFQASVPHIDLIHGVSDRFWLELAARVRYKPDAGTVPIPEFIHGTLRAQYRIDKIDPSCFGWQKLAAEYLWIRAIGDTVSFTGTAEDDANELSLSAAGMDPATADARITRLARVLLTNRFEATPHKVSHRFRRGSMRSLHVGANRSVVAVPIVLSGNAPSGRIDSINQDLLEGRDFGIAIDRDFIMARVQEQLDVLRASIPPTFWFHHKTSVDLGALGGFDVLTVKITWTITTTAGAQWLGVFPPIGPTIPGGLIAVTLAAQARTSKATFNFDFDVTQLLLLSFDGSTEQFTVAPMGAATVNLHGTFAAIVAPTVKPIILKAVADGVKNAAGGMGGDLSLGSRKQELIDQLQMIDDQANAWLDEAVFTPDGVIVRGQVALSPRRGPVVSFAMTAEQDGYSALQSWIPGGRIDSFQWFWTWFNNAGSAGSDTWTDRFVLRRPPGAGQGRFGAVLGLHRPLPGLDGMGKVCLVLNGVYVHPTTGELVPVSTARMCTRFGFDIRLAVPGRVFLREWVPGPRDLIGPVAEVAVHEIGGPNTGGHGANTLLVRVGDQWNSEVALSLRDGLATSRRWDAGLVVLVLFNDGALMRAAEEPMAEFGHLIAELEAPLVVNEDVHGSWSKALRMDSEPGVSGELEWRIISPTGGVMWAHRGSLPAEELASALDDYLLRSPAARVPQIAPGMTLGTQISSLALDDAVKERLTELESSCPPPPFGRLGVDATIAFVSIHSAASEAAIRKVADDHGSQEAESFVVVVVDGAGADDIERLRLSLPEGVMAIPDPDGMISRRFGVRMWPTTVTVSENGQVTAFEMGLDNTVRPPRSGEAS